MNLLITLLERLSNWIDLITCNYRRKQAEKEQTSTCEKGDYEQIQEVLEKNIWFVPDSNVIEISSGIYRITIPDHRKEIYNSLVEDYEEQKTVNQLINFIYDC